MAGGGGGSGRQSAAAAEDGGEQPREVDPCIDPSFLEEDAIAAAVLASQFEAIRQKEKREEELQAEEVKWKVGAATNSSDMFV